MTQSIGHLGIGLALFLASFANLGLAQGTATSADWSGYVVNGSEFTLATGSWHVPEVNCSKTPYDFSIFWVGIDGWKNSPNTVEQAGTSSNCGGATGTTPEYFAWYEFYEPPGVPRVVITSVPVRPGDEIGAYVEYSVSFIKGIDIEIPYWTIWLKDFTTGKIYTGQFPYNSNQQRASAEWIVERPCCNGDNGLDEPLADFDKANFGGYLTDVPGTNWATDSTHSGFIGQFGDDALAVTMEYPEGTVLATPGPLEGPQGSSFTVTWKATGP
jgi:Peptidase A4 family